MLGCCLLESGACSGAAWVSYATQAEIDARYPGELEKAGFRTPDGVLDPVAIGFALEAASAMLDRSLGMVGWTVPLAVNPAPAWVRALVIDIALYLATPTVLASLSEFADRHRRYKSACDQLAAIADGNIYCPPLADGVVANLPTIHPRAAPRCFGRGAL